MRAEALLELRRRLPALGADVALVPWLDAAMDADRIIAAGLDGEAGGPHLLAGWVHTRATVHMLAWALNGTSPLVLTGRLSRPSRGPAAVAPQLAAADRAVFFDRLRDTTKAAARQGAAAPSNVLPRFLRPGAGLGAVAGGTAAAAAGRRVDDTTRGAASFISEMGVLKRVTRSDWWFTGNKAPESVAEQSFRVGVIGFVLAMMEGVAPTRAALMCRRRGSGASPRRPQVSARRAER